MKTSTASIRAIADANTVYACTGRCTLHRYRVYHPVLRSFSTLVNVLERSLGEEVTSDFWGKVLRRLKQHRFYLAAAPLPLSFDAVALTTFLREAAQQCTLLYPDYAAILAEILSQSGILARSDDNPLLESLERLASNLAESALLLKEPRLASIVEPLLAAHPVLASLEIVSAAELRGARMYEDIFIIGPGSWFRDHEYVLTAPRARKLSLIRFSWIGDTWVREPTFVGVPPVKAAKSSLQSLLVDEVNLGGGSVEDTASSISNDTFDVLPAIDWQRLSTRMKARTADEHDQEEVEARLYALAGDMGVMLETGEHSTALVIDLTETDTGEAEHEAAVRRVPVSDIRPDMFLLLRTSGGGDYVMQVADMMLRHEAKLLRAKQEEWKSRLRRYVHEFGIQDTVAGLRRRGSVRASDYLVRNWFSTRNIRPLDERDFRAIMQLVGLVQEENQYWQNARRIEAAHRAAGFQIRKLLLQQVTRADLRPLLRNGRMDFELPEAAGGALTAYRVEQIAPGTIVIPVTSVGRIFNLEEM